MVYVNRKLMDEVHSVHGREMTGCDLKFHIFTLIPKGLDTLKLKGQVDFMLQALVCIHIFFRIKLKKKTQTIRPYSIFILMY